MTELKEKIVAIDHSFASLTNLLETYMKSSGYPMTAAATNLLEGIEGMCRKKCRTGVTGEDVDLSCELKEPAKVDGEDFCIPDDGNINIGEYSDDANSVSDAVTQRSEGTETHDHTEADFDNLLAYIVHGRITCEKDATSPYSNPPPFPQVITSDGPDRGHL